MRESNEPSPVGNYTSYTDTISLGQQIRAQSIISGPSFDGVAEMPSPDEARDILRWAGEL
jgi:hypothetical protein